LYELNNQSNGSILSHAAKSNFLIWFKSLSSILYFNIYFKQKYNFIIKNIHNFNYFEIILF
jgi:hypothetical protein